MNNNPFYITTNHVPNFGEEDPTWCKPLDVQLSHGLCRMDSKRDQREYQHRRRGRAMVRAWVSDGHDNHQQQGMKLFQPWKVKALSHLHLEKPLQSMRLHLLSMTTSRSNRGTDV